MPQFRGGGRAHGPVVRSHEHELPKKVRALGLRHALSAKAAAGSIVVVSAVALAEAKTKAAKDVLAKLGLANALFISGAEVDNNFGLAVRNIANIDALPVAGATIRGRFLLLLELLDAEEDGDAAFFSRDLEVTGDTEAVVRLRNALDDMDGSVAEEAAGMFGRPGRALLAHLRRRYATIPAA